MNLKTFFLLILFVNYAISDGEYLIDPNGYVAFCPCMGERILNIEKTNDTNFTKI